VRSMKKGSYQPSLRAGGEGDAQPSQALAAVSGGWNGSEGFCGVNNALQSGMMAAFF